MSRTILLSNVSLIIMGQSPKGESYNTETKGVPLLNGAADYKGNVFKPKFFTSKPTKKVEAGDIIIGIRATIGNLAFADKQYCIGRGCAGIRVDGNIINKRFAAIYINQAVKEMVNKVSGSTIKGLRKEDIEKIQIPLSPLHVQKKIVEVLDKAQELIDLRKQQIELLDDLIQSIFYDMFGDPVKNIKEFKVTKLNNYIEFITSGSRGWAKYYSEVGQLFIRIQNIKNYKLDFPSKQYINVPETKEATRTKVKTGDLIISITADLGRTAVVDKKTANSGAYINQHLCLLRLKSVLQPKYLAFYIESNAGKAQIEKYNQVGVKSGLNFNAIKSLSILVPPVNLQNEFIKTISRVEIQKEIMQDSLEKIEINYNNLLQRVFKGELFDV